MAEYIRQPDELILTGNIAENWQQFKQESGFDAKPDKQKVALFLHVARKQAIEEFNTFALNSEEKANYDVVVGTFKSQCNPKIKAQTCQFENLKDSTIRDRLVLGITCQRMRGGCYLWMT